MYNLGVENQPLYFSVTGPDGAGKDTAWRFAKPHLPTELIILRIGKPSAIIQNGHETYVQARASDALDKLHEWADARRNRNLISVVNTLSVLFRWRVQEPYLSKKFQPHVIFSLRDGYVDPSAYAPYYAPETLGRMAIPDRITLLKKLHGAPFRDYTILLDVDPAVAVQRINERMQREAELRGLHRPKWLHQHENEGDLRNIREEYHKTVRYLDELGKTAFEVVDTREHSKEQIGEIVAGRILSLLGVPLAA